MLKRVENLEGDTLGFEAVGEVTGEDYEKTLIPALEESLQKHDKINFLYLIGDNFKSFDLKAMYDDSMVGVKHFFDFNKIAVVTNKDWIKNLTKAFAPLYPMQIKAFDTENLQEAIKWLQQKRRANIHIELLKDDGIVIFEPTKPLNQKDFEYVNSIVNPYLEQHKELKGVIIRTKQFPGWDSLASIKAHFEFIKTHHEKTKKLAFVTDSSLITAFEHIAKFVVHPEVKEFDYNQLEEAIEWVKN